MDNGKWIIEIYDPDTVQKGCFPSEKPNILALSILNFPFSIIYNCKWLPPVIRIWLPVSMLASSPARNAIAPATSSG